MQAAGALLLGWLLALMGLPGPVYADGGAPNLAYVAGGSTGVSLIDIAQQRVSRAFPVSGGPSMLLLSPDGSLLYVAQPGSGTVVALAAKTGQVICQASFQGHPARLALSVDATILYVAGLHETTLLALNARTCAQEASFQTPEPVSWLAATLANGSADEMPRTQLWIAGANEVSILDDQGRALDHIPIAGGPAFLCLPGALTAYVATRQGSLLALDMLSHRVIGTLLTGGVFGSMDYNAVTDEIYVPDQRSRQIDVLTPVLSSMAITPSEPAYTLPVSGSPQAIAITNDGQLGFVALGNGQVAMLDIPGRRAIKTIAVGGSPQFIITGAYPPSIVPQPVAPPATSPWAWLLLALLGVVLAVGVGSGGFFWWKQRQKKRQVSLKSSSIQ